MSRFRSVFLTFFLLPLLAQAKLSLAPIFTDHMILQRDQNIPVWGTAKPGEKITINLANQQRDTTTDKHGSWSAQFKPLSVSPTSITLKVASTNETLTRSDILIGDVWIATGQSNMLFTLAQSQHGPESLQNATDPQLRLLNYKGSLHPGNKKYNLQFLTNVTTSNYFHKDGWQTSGPKSARDFSAVAYYFAQKVRKHTNIPIGVINLSVGGSPIEAHISPATISSTPQLAHAATNWWKNEDYPQWCRQRAALNLTHWLSSPELKSKSPPHPFAPHFLWDAGIAKILPLPVKGILWYQGESNATIDGAHGPAVDPALNKLKFKALVNSWRTAWANPSLPVYFVQLPNMNRNWPLFREMQAEASHELKHAHMAVSIDVGHPTNVHPTNKMPVGERLARLALAHTYNQNIIPSGPEYKSSIFKNNNVYINFENANGLKPSNGKTITGFELAAADREFHPAEATASNGKLQVSSEHVATPLFIRYAWANNPVCNLVNAEDLPASPFRAKSPAAPVRIACIGDSITEGLSIKNPDHNSYPAQLQKLLGDKFFVKNFGNSGRGIVQASKRGNQKRAFIFMPEHKKAQEFQPDIVICNLGINDLMDWNKFGETNFVSDYRTLIQSYKSLDSRPRIIIWQPLAPLFKGQKFHGNPNIQAINRSITSVASLEQLETIDMEKPLKSKSSLFPDHIHPNAEGAKIIAQTIQNYLKVNK